MISPLAKGADRIVAQAVLERRTGRLHAITPFVKADYEKDFTETGDLEQFRELWDKASEKHELGCDYGDVLPSDTETEKQNKQILRNEGYLRVGRETVDACEILIAIWDGESAAGKGGTGDVVAYAIERGRAVFWIDVNNPPAAAKMIVQKSSDGELDGPLAGTTTKPISSRAEAHFAHISTSSPPTTATQPTIRTNTTSFMPVMRLICGGQPQRRDYRTNF